MQKVFMFLLSIALVLGFSACGGGGDSSVSSDNPDRKGTGIKNPIKQNLPGPFVGAKAGQFGEYDVSRDEDYQKLVDAVNNKGALFLDIRNDYERSEGVDDYYASGTVTGAIYEFRPSPKRINPDFVKAVDSMLNGDKNRQIILICNSASRTSKAASWLAAPKSWREFKGGGYNNVYHVVGAIKGEGGMEAWVRAGRPTGKEPLK